MTASTYFFYIFSFNHPATTEIYTLSLHDALPISNYKDDYPCRDSPDFDYDLELRSSPDRTRNSRSEEHTSELQSHSDLVCRLLLEKKKNTTTFRNKIRATESSHKNSKHHGCNT